MHIEQKNSCQYSNVDTCNAITQAPSPSAAGPRERVGDQALQLGQLSALPLATPLHQILVLVSVPDINLLDYLPEILDGLFQILGDNGKEIRKM